MSIKNEIDRWIIGGQVRGLGIPFQYKSQIIKHAELPNGVSTFDL